MGSPLAKHVPVVLTALLVRQVVRILQLLVLLEPMLVVQQPFVSYVVLENTMNNKDKQVAHHVVLGNTMINKDKLPNQVANHVVLGNTTIIKDKLPNPLPAKVALLGNTTT